MKCAAERELTLGGWYKLHFGLWASRIGAE